MSNAIKQKIMKVNFAKIEIEGIEKKEAVDLRKQIGNYLYYQSQDLQGSELGRGIYFADAEKGLEITDEEKKLITDAVKTLFKPYVIRTAIEKALEQGV